MNKVPNSRFSTLRRKRTDAGSVTSEARRRVCGNTRSSIRSPPSRAISARRNSRRKSRSRITSSATPARGLSSTVSKLWEKVYLLTTIAVLLPFQMWYVWYGLSFQRWPLPTQAYQAQDQEIMTILRICWWKLKNRCAPLFSNMKRVLAKGSRWFSLSGPVSVKWRTRQKSALT